jgi:NitT/TauT family transport system substrate-binding protein
MPLDLSRSAILTGFAATISGATLPRIASAQTQPLRIAGVFSDLFAEPFYAKGAGAFAKAGFDVDAISLNNAGAVAAAIGGGSLELGTAGVPILLIAGGGMYRQRADSGSTILAVATDSPIRTPKDLIGKSIGVPTLVGMTTACVRAWLPANGVPESSVKFVEIPQSSSIPALQRGTIDAGLLSEPFVTFGNGVIRAVGSPYDVAADRAPNKEFCVSVWYASKPWFEQDPARWANAHRDDTFAILVRDGKLDADKAHGMQRTTYATSLSPSLVQPVLDIAMQNKMFSKAVDAATLITKA